MTSNFIVKNRALQRSCAREIHWEEEVSFIVIMEE
jgi:hypothetical protein